MSDQKVQEHRSISKTGPEATRTAPQAPPASVGSAVARLSASQTDKPAQSPASGPDQGWHPEPKEAAESSPAPYLGGLAENYGEKPAAPTDREHAPVDRTVGAQGVTEKRTYQDEGVIYQETTGLGRNGSKNVERTYVKDGIAYDESTLTLANGDVKVRVEASKGDQTEITETNSRYVEGKLQDYVPDQVAAGLNLQDGKVRQSSTTTQTVDNSQDPPIITVKARTESWSQETEYKPEKDGKLNLPSVTRIPTWNGHADTEGQKVQWDPSSGRTISYTTSTGPDGKSSQLDNQIHLKGKGEDGQDVTVSFEENRQYAEDFTVKTGSVVTESKGLTSKDAAVRQFAGEAGQGLDPFYDRIEDLPGNYVDYRTTKVLGDQTLPVVTEIGNYNQPDQDGGTITSVRTGGDQVALTYRKVSDAGQHVQEQTVVPGADYNKVSDKRAQDDGSFVATTRETQGGKILSENMSTRELAYPAGKELPEEVPPDQPLSQAQWDEFRKAHPQGPVYLDQFDGSQTDGDAKMVTTSQIAYSSGASSVGSATVDGERVNYYQLDGPEPRAGLEMDGQKAQIAADGSVSVNGQVVKTGAAGVKLASGPRAYLKLVGELRDDPKLLGQSAKLSRWLGPAAVAFGLGQFFSAGEARQKFAAAGTTLSGSKVALDGFGTAGKASRVLGGAGGALTFGVGVKELVDGDLAEGVSDVVGGGAAVGAVILPLLGVPGAGPILAGVAALAGIVRLGIDFFSEKEIAPLEF